MEKDCPNCKFELYEADEIPCKDCGMDDREYWQPKPQTNADRIRAMSDEELAIMFYRMCVGMEFCDECPAVNNCPGESVGHWEGWLKQPADM